MSPITIGNIKLNEGGMIYADGATFDQRGNANIVTDGDLPRPPEVTSELSDKYPGEKLAWMPSSGVRVKAIYNPVLAGHETGNRRTGRWVLCNGVSSVTFSGMEWALYRNVGDAVDDGEHVQSGGGDETAPVQQEKEPPTESPPPPVIRTPWLDAKYPNMRLEWFPADNGSTGYSYPDFGDGRDLKGSWGKVKIAPREGTFVDSNGKKWVMFANY